MHIYYMWHCKTYFVNKIVGKTLSNTLFWSWLSRIDYFENNRQNLCSHPQLNFWLVIFANNWLFSDITSCYLKISSCRWLKENNRLLFSTTGKDDQGLYWHIKGPIITLMADICTIPVQNLWLCHCLDGDLPS